MRDFNNTKPATQQKYSDDKTFLFKFYNFSVKNKYTKQWDKYNAFVDLVEGELKIDIRSVGSRGVTVDVMPLCYTEVLDSFANGEYTDIDYQEEAGLLLDYIKNHIEDYQNF